MQVQSIQSTNNSSKPNFKAITNIKIKGKNFRKAPEYGQNILESIVPNKNFNFPNESVRLVIQDTDLNDFWTCMKYGITEFEKKHLYNNTITVFIYKNFKGNIFSRAWNYMKYILTDGPSIVKGAGQTFEAACEDIIEKLNNV